VRFVVVSLALLVASPAVAQVPADPDRAVSGPGIRVEGWRGRTDRSEQKVTDVRFVEWKGGYRLTTGPHAIVWHPSHKASGEYTVTARLTKTPESVSSHEESYGVFIAGTDLDGPRQNYLYCVVFGSGKVMLRHRSGSETATLLGKTANAAISAPGGSSGTTDEVSLWVRGGRVGCSVNGAEVFSASVASMVGPGKLVQTDGMYGLRASHNLDVIVDWLRVTPAR
jgi:hypothetical protein